MIYLLISLAFFALFMKWYIGGAKTALAEGLTGDQVLTLIFWPFFAALMALLWPVVIAVFVHDRLSEAAHKLLSATPSS